jgi:ribonuclease R
MSELDVTKEQIYDFIRQNPEKPWHLQELQKRLKAKERAPLRQHLAELVEDGKLIRTRRRSYGLPQEMNLLLGRLQITSGGYGFVIPEKQGEKDLFIPVDSLAGAWDGDRVVARPNPARSDNGRISGEIVRILARKYDQVVGTLEYARGYAILRPDSTRLRERILLLPESVGRLDAGSRIVARMHWPETTGEKDPFAEVTEVLGSEADAETETRAVIIKYGLKDAFDDATLAEAKAVPPKVTGEMMEGRTDLRGVPTMTIDGADAKDFYDAISLERVGDGAKGLLRVGVHIADVSYYVAEGTSLDKEAVERATSVYLPGKVLPMLPEELSNGICSLVEGEPRLALSVLVDVTRDGEVKSVRFKETVIQSDARLTYEEVQAFADGGRLPAGKRKLERDIKVLLTLTQKLRELRLGAGALDFDFTEAKVDVDEQGALHVMPIRSNTARQLIEELMLLANRLVAQDLSKRDIPALYRVHEDPSEEKIQNLQRALGRLGYQIDLENAGPQQLQDIIKKAAGKPEAQLVSTLLLRSLKQARYSAENKGHFGLAFEHYLHFTSPIRRYPDLVVHRVLRASLQRRLSPTLKERMRSDFPGLAEHTSERERNAEDAERDLTKFFHGQWAKEHVGETFSGVVSGVTNFGVFVSLPNGVEGLIHVSQLDDDYYMYLEDSLMLLGKHTRRKFRMGDRTEVKILASNPVQRQIDLIPGYMDMPDAEPEERAEQSAPKTLKTPIAAKPEEAKPRDLRLPRPAPAEPAGPPTPPEAKADPQPRDKRQDPAQQNPARQGPVQQEPPQQDPARQDPVRQNPARRESGAQERKPQREQVEAGARPAPRRKRVLIFGDPGRRK